MNRLVSVLAGFMAAGLCASASPGQASVVRACLVDNPPANCEIMWALVAHVNLPKQSAAVVHPTPLCGPAFDGISWGMVVADAFGAEVGPDRLQRLAIDVSGAFQAKLIPQVTRHIRGDAAAFIADGFSKVVPQAWSPSANTHDRALCAPIIAIVPAEAVVWEFRYLAGSEALGAMGCTATRECPVGQCRFVRGYDRPQRTTGGGMAVFTAIFQSWASDGPREGRLIVFFEMPAGEAPAEHF